MDKMRSELLSERQQKVESGKEKKAEHSEKKFNSLKVKY